MYEKKGGAIVTPKKKNEIHNIYVSFFVWMHLNRFLDDPSTLEEVNYTKSV